VTCTYLEFKTTIGKTGHSISQHTWKPTRMAEVEERQLTWWEVKCTAQNRVRRQALVDNICSTRKEED